MNSIGYATNRSGKGIIRRAGQDLPEIFDVVQDHVQHEYDVVDLQ